MTRKPVVDNLAMELDAWDVLADGSLWFQVRDQGPPHGRVKGRLLMERTIPPSAWHWEEIKE